MTAKLNTFFYKDGTNSNHEDEAKTLHREGGPARITYYENGSIESERYFCDGKLHRTDGPAIIQRYESGSIAYERYCINGMCHRQDGPAYIDYYEDGTIKGELYHISHKLHRLDGPAIIGRDHDGSIGYEKYHVEGEELSKEEFLPKRHKIAPFSETQLISMSSSDCEKERGFAKRLLTVIARKTS